MKDHIIALDMQLHIHRVSFKDMPDGTAVGAMNFWDGTNWVSISPGANGEVLKFVNNAPAWSAIGTTYYLDADADGYGDSTKSIIIIASSYIPNGIVIDYTDCDDADATVNIVTQTWFIDSDGDGYGVSSTLSCARPTNGFLLTELSGTGTDDCDDADATIKPSTVWYSPNNNEYYHQCNSPTAGAYVVYFYPHSNNVTCMCPDAANGSSGTVNGITYTKRTRAEITPDNAATTCTSGITDMSNLFNGNTSFNEDISSWDVSSVTTMKLMFRNAHDFNQNIGNWDTSNVTNMEVMFGDASAFNQDLSGWCVSNFSTQPSFFNSGTNNWILPQPFWGTCPQ